MTQGVSPINSNPGFDPTSSVFRAPTISDVQNLNNIANASRDNFLSPVDSFRLSDASAALNTAVLDASILPNFPTIRSRFKAWDDLGNFDLDTKVVVLVDLLFEPAVVRTPAETTIQTMLLASYPEVDPYYRSLILESLKNNVDDLLPFINDITTEITFQDPEDNLALNFLRTLAKDEESSIAQLRLLASRLLTTVVEKSKFNTNILQAVFEARQNVVVQKARADGGDARMWYNLMPELESPSRSIDTEDGRIRNVGHSDEVVDAIPYQIGKAVHPRIKRHGLAIVLHSSASMSKFYATVSGLDVFRLPLDISAENIDAFFSKLLSKGFQDVIVLMPDTEIWQEFKKINEEERPGIHLINTKTAGLGLGMILNEMIKHLSDKEFVILEKNWIEELTLKLRHWVLVFNHHRIEKNEWLKHYSYKSSSKVHTVCVMANDSRPNVGTWSATLSEGFDLIKNEIEERFQEGTQTYSRIVIVHESPYKDDVVSFAYELRKTLPSISILVRHHAPRQKPFFGRHISVAVI